ncbi:hypothetical protein, partial [Bacillus toyonensis]
TGPTGPTGPTCETTGTFANPEPITINDDTLATPYPSSIEVTGLCPTITKVTATLKNMSHTFPDDIHVLLVGPQEQALFLMADVGGNIPINNVTLTFDDDAATTLPDEGPIFSGTYQPDPEDFPLSMPAPAPPAPYGSALSVFDGTNPNGTWNLFIVDFFAGDAGFIAGGWELTITAV